MMDMMITAAKRNMEVLAEMQQRNEEMVQILLNHAVKSREQMMATNEAILGLMGKQGQAAESFVSESIKTGREMMEKQIAETRKAVSAN